VSTTVSEHQNSSAATVKLSGYGKDLSAFSLEGYTQIKHVTAKID